MVQKLPRTWIYLIWIGVPSAEESSKSHKPVPNHCCMNLSPDSTVELPYLHSAVRGGDKSIPGTLGINHRDMAKTPSAVTGILALAAFRWGCWNPVAVAEMAAVPNSRSTTTVCKPRMQQRWKIHCLALLGSFSSDNNFLSQDRFWTLDLVLFFSYL